MKTAELEVVRLKKLLKKAYDIIPDNTDHKYLPEIKRELFSKTYKLYTEKPDDTDRLAKIEADRNEKPGTTEWFSFYYGFIYGHQTYAQQSVSRETADKMLSRLKNIVKCWDEDTFQEIDIDECREAIQSYEAEMKGGNEG